MCTVFKLACFIFFPYWINCTHVCSHIIHCRRWPFYRKIDPTDLFCTTAVWKTSSVTFLVISQTDETFHYVATLRCIYIINVCHHCVYTRIQEDKNISNRCAKYVKYYNILYYTHTICRQWDNCAYIHTHSKWTVGVNIWNLESADARRAQASYNNWRKI